MNPYSRFPFFRAEQGGPYMPSNGTEGEMKPINFNDEMVRTIIEGRKTLTRRPVKWPLYSDSDGTKRRIFGISDVEIVKEAISQRQKYPLLRVCPYGQVGDRLYVKESFLELSDEDSPYEPPIFRYRATETENYVLSDGDGYTILNADGSQRSPWKSGALMPKQAARIFLHITNIRVERVQEITEQDAIEEGWPKASRDFSQGPGNGGPFDWFRSVWDSIYEKKGLGWGMNPWVWVIEFKRVEGK